MDQQLELIEFNIGTSTNENILKVQVAPHIAKRCRNNPAYSQSLLNQISKKRLDGVTSIKVTPVPTTKEDLKNKYWNDREVNCFLKIYKKYHLMKNSGTHENKKWLMISEELAKKNIHKSSDRCRQKWKNLLRSYNNAKKHSLTTKFSYVQQIFSILHQDGASIDVPDASSSDDNDSDEDSKIIQEVSDSSKREVWSKYEILKFLKEFQKYRSDPHYKSEKQYMHLLSKKLEKEGIFKSPKKLHIKWKNLNNSYKSINLKNKSPVKFEFYNEVKSLIEGDELPEPDLAETSNERDVEPNYTSWSGEETLKLIELYKKNKHLFNEIPKKMAWRIVSSDLHSEGIKKDADKCENKWKNLIRSYKRNKAYNNNSRFYFFNEMKEILEDERYLDESTSQVVKVETDHEDNEAEEEEAEELEEEEEEEEEMDAQEIESDEDLDSFEEITIDTNAEHNYSWSTDEITLLLSSYDQNSPNKKNLNRSLWKLVSADMELNNFERDPEECKKMCDTLLEEYKKHKDSKTKHGFPFFKDIERILPDEKLDVVKHHDLCKCFEKRALDKERRHTERMQCLKRKLDIEDRKVTAFEKYVQHLTETSASTL